jgi:homoserine kinase type II
MPSPSMHWESVDATEALTKRFGFASAASAVDCVGDALWDGWAIAVDGCDRLVISAENVLAWVTSALLGVEQSDPPGSLTRPH